MVNNAQHLKKELLEDLDQFLVDENIPVSDRILQKQNALAELDKLIKQDLSYNQILTTIKKDTQKKLEQPKKEPAPTKKNILTKPVNKSAHIVDLRKEKSQPSIRRPYETLERYHSWGEKLKKSISTAQVKNTRQLSSPVSVSPKIKKIKKQINLPSVNLPHLNLSGIFPKVVVFALIMTVILLPIRGLVLVGKIQNDKQAIVGFGQEGLLNLQAGVISASGNSYEDAQADFEKSLDSFQQAQAVLDEYHTWMVNVSSMLPVVGKPISLSKNLIAVATNISEAATILNQKLKVQENPTEYLAVINTQINQTLPYLRSAQRDLNGISSGLLPENLQPYFNSLKIYLPTTIESLDNLNNIFSLVQDLLGHQAEKRYLILFQNNNEIRPTGGFIGSFAVFDVYQGKIVSLEIPEGGTYDLDAGQTVKYKAPEALSLVNAYFNIWDANWWYDFPTSAEKITNLYQASGESSVNGVIAINAEVLKELLAVLGPIYMEDYNITIDADNIYLVLQEEVELNYDKEANTPKAVIADLVPVVLEKLLSNTDKYKDIVTVFARMLSSKDIQIYSNEPATQEKIKNFGWAGQVVETDRDYLAVINTTIGGGKFDNNIYQTIDHQSEIQLNGDIINTVRITRINKDDGSNPFIGIEGGSASYMRIYVPYGSEFIQGVGFDGRPLGYLQEDARAVKDPDLVKEEDKMIDGASGVEIYNSLNKTVFANWMVLQPGEQKTVLLKYKLPFQLDLGNQLVNDWWRKIFKKDLRLDNYSLVVQSQSGSQHDIINSSILLPDNIRVVWNNASDEDNMNITDDLVTYHTELIRDQYFGFIIATK